MQRRHEADNIPIELLRSFVVIQELGSFTKAAETLFLTQPAISAQMKRLQRLVGGEVFIRSGFGISLSEKGKIINRYARGILAMNDQIMSLSGTVAGAEALRVGIPNVYASAVLPEMIAACNSSGEAGRVHFACEPSAHLARNLADGCLDLVFMPSVDVPRGVQLEQWSEPMCWVCAPEFSTSPGAPIRLQSWPQSVADQIAIEALENAGLPYVIVFTGSDMNAHLAALRCGIGYFVLPQRLVPPDIKIAREHFLPALPHCRTGIYLYNEKEMQQLARVASQMVEILRPRTFAPAFGSSPELLGS